VKIVFHPFSSGDNKYTDIILEALRDRKFEIIPLDKLFSNFRDVKIIHLNWYENIASVLNFLNKTFKLLVWKLLGKKIVWTMHNKEPHENKNPSLQKAFRNLLIFLSDSIVIHSNESREELESKGKTVMDKVLYLPHPNYIDAYGDMDVKTTSLINQEPLNLLFIGMVRPYKNLELLMDCVATFGDKVKLIIAGKPKDSEYAKTIEEIASSQNNIELDLNFIEDDDLIKYVSATDLVVLPYNMNSVLNSGTVILSFSYGRSVICPNIGTINDIDDKSNLMNYTYTTQEEHKKELIRLIDRAIRLKQDSPKIFENWGTQMKDYIEKYHDPEDVANQLTSEYFSISK